LLKEEANSGSVIECFSSLPPGRESCTPNFIEVDERCTSEHDCLEEQNTDLGVVMRTISADAMKRCWQVQKGHERVEVSDVTPDQGIEKGWRGNTKRAFPGEIIDVVWAEVGRNRLDEIWKLVIGGFDRQTGRSGRSLGNISCTRCEVGGTIWVDQRCPGHFVMESLKSVMVGFLKQPVRLPICTVLERTESLGEARFNSPLLAGVALSGAQEGMCFSYSGSHSVVCLLIG